MYRTIEEMDAYFEAQDDIRATTIRCDCCGEVIGEGETVYDFGSETICEGCIRDWLDEYRREVSYE